MTINSSSPNDFIIPSLVNGGATKPLLAMAAVPAAGHMAPLLTVAGELIKRGFEIIFMTTAEFRAGVEKIGAEFYDSPDFFSLEVLKERETYPQGIPKLMFDLEKVFIASIPSRTAAFRSMLEFVRERDPSRDVVVISETMSQAVVAFRYGAPLPKGYTEFPRSITLNLSPILSSSVDIAPIGTGLPPDSSESGRLRNQFLFSASSNGPLSQVNDTFHKTLQATGCTSLPDAFVWDVWSQSYDTTFQMCSPGMEYPRSDLHPSIRFAGAVPLKTLSPDLEYPSWWSEIEANARIPESDRKKVVFVTQGTVQTAYDELIIPTIRALSGREDVIVVALLGVKGAALPAGLAIPANTRVLDYFPYDAVLQHADVFVSNGGYGGLMHGVLNGVPMVLAGITEDKIEVAARAEWAGFAVNLRTQTPTSQQVLDGTVKVLTNPSYKLRAVRQKQENEDMDSLRIIEKEIMKYARS